MSGYPKTYQALSTMDKTVCTPLYLLIACSVNARGQIIGLAFDTATNELHGYLATPNYGGRLCKGLRLLILH
jgi:hypothetical protein